MARALFPLSAVAIDGVERSGGLSAGRETFQRWQKWWRDALFSEPGQVFGQAVAGPGTRGRRPVVVAKTWLLLTTHSTPFSPSTALSSILFPPITRTTPCSYHRVADVISPRSSVGAAGMMQRSKRTRDSIGEGASGSVRSLTDADIAAIVNTMEPRMTAKVMGSIADGVVDVVADKVALSVAENVAYKMSDEVIDELTDKVAVKVVHEVADSVALKISDSVPSDARVQIIIEPICAALADAVVSHKEAFPEVAELAAAVAVPVVGAVHAAAAQAAVPAQVSLAWEQMSMDQLRMELNRVAPWRVLRPVDNEVLNRFIPLLAAENWDVLSELCPQARRGPGSNQFPHRGADRMAYKTMKTVKQKVSASGTVPEIFRDWISIWESDKSLRHQAYVAHTRNSRNDGRSRMRRMGYKRLWYACENRHRPGVDIKMLHPNAVQPPPSQAAGSDYFAYQRSVVVCASGRLQPAEDNQRTSVLKTTACLMTDAEDLLNEYARTTFSWRDETLAAVARNMRGIIEDVQFNWNELCPADNVGTRTNGPGCWRLLLPRLTTRADVAVEVQTLSEDNMDLLDAGLALHDVPEHVGVLVGGDDDDFGMDEDE